MTAHRKANLSDVCEIAMGQAPKGTSYNADGRGYALVAGAGDFGESSPAPGKYTDAPTKLSRPGDIILCIRATIGDRNWADGEYCLGRGVAGLRAHELELNQAYLWHWLGYIAPTLRSRGRGATFLQVSKADIATLQIPLPPLADQKRIAHILDAADDLRAKRRESIEQLNALIQSVFLDMFGDPIENPHGWPVEPFGDWLEGIDSGWSPKCLGRKASTEEWGVLKLGAVTRCEFDEEQQKALPPEETARAENEVAPGDLLFTRKNTHELVAAAAYVHAVRPKLMLPDLIFRLRLRSDSRVLSKFLWGLLVQPHQRKSVQRLATGAAGSMPNISKTRLSQAHLIKPPLELQQRFATVVDSIEKQKDLMRAHLAELDTLFASLQQRAFNGEL